MRCAICHDSLGEPRTICAACRSAAHGDCRADLGRCPTLGCVASVRRLVPTVHVAAPGGEQGGSGFPGCLLGCALATVITLVTIVLGAWYMRIERPRQWRAELSAQVRAVEPALVAYVREIRSGKHEPWTHLKVPALPPGGPPIESVLMDDRGNIIFQTAHHLEWNAGFEFRNGTAKINGTGHGQIYLEHMFGDWWLFRDSGL